MKGRRNLS